MKQWRISILMLIFVWVIIIVIIGGSYKQIQDVLFQLRARDIMSHYDNFVISGRTIPLYKKTENSYIEVGKIEKNQSIQLEDNYDDSIAFYPLKNDNNYYVKYNDVLPVTKIDDDNRYKNYVPFNESIVTLSSFDLYNDHDEMVFSFNQSLTFPIIIKDNDRYYVEYDNKLLYIKKQEVSSIISNSNTSFKATLGIQVLAYHFFYKKGETKCNQDICIEINAFEQQLKYLKDNHFFFVKMDELEDYIDGKIRLPEKSIVITIDDGWLAHDGLELLKKYKIDATLFLITSAYDQEDFANEYLEVHSHGHNLHTPGVCPDGQGGGIRCLPHDQILNDLKTSRKELNNTTVFCYPFYEYNNYAISILKEAGFTMAFTGMRTDPLVRVGSNKFRLPRYTVRSYLTLNNFKKLVE